MVFQNIIVKDDHGISKVIKISLLNLNEMVFRSEKSTEKKVRLSGTTPSYIPDLMKYAILGHFS